jgi:hypothetical protein
MDLSGPGIDVKLKERKKEDSHNKLCNRNLAPKKIYLHKINTGPGAQGKKQVQFSF